MANPKAIGSSLTVLLVSDLARTQAYYRDVLGFNVTDLWVERDGLSGLALKLQQAAKPDDVRPNAPAAGHSVGVDIYAYVDTWAQLEGLFNEFKEKGAHFAQDMVTYPEGGPWKEFIVRDPDGYAIAFGGVDGRPGGRRSPLRPHIGSAILWVRNLDRAAERYAQLFDLSVKATDRFFGHMHVFKLENGTDLVLDSNGMEDVPIPERGPVLFMVHTDNIDAAYHHAVSLGFEVVFGIVRYPGMSFFNIRDEDGNIITVTQSHGKPDSGKWRLEKDANNGQDRSCADSTI